MQYSDYVEEYCALCDTPMWFMQPGDLIVPMDDMEELVSCNCKWGCCTEVDAFTHQPHQARRQRKPGIYKMSQVQIAKYHAFMIDGFTMIDAICATLPVLYSIGYFDFDTTTMVILFDEADVSNYSRGTPIPAGKRRGHKII